MPDNVRGSLPPLPKIRKDVLRVNTAESHTFIILSASIWGQYVHWYGNRSHECTQEKLKQCNGCERSWPVKWKGYLHVRNITNSWSGFLEITETAYRLIDHQLGTEKNLRGVKIKISRTKGGAKGRYQVEVFESRVDSDLLERELDPYDTLKFLWSCKRPAGQQS
jgi:hypothetical protein